MKMKSVFEIQIPTRFCFLGARKRYHSRERTDRFVGDITPTVGIVITHVQRTWTIHKLPPRALCHSCYLYRVWTQSTSSIPFWKERWKGSCCFFRLLDHHRGSGCSFIDWMRLAQVSGAEKEVEELSSSVESIFIYKFEACVRWKVRMFWVFNYNVLS